jgi:L-aspartate oxidase
MSFERTDVLVLGGGLAGLSLALRVAGRQQVTVVTKTEFPASNTWWAQGGIAAVVTSEDSFERHISDTEAAGAGLVNAQVARRVVEAAPGLVFDLEAWGVEFDRQDQGEYDLGREGGHGLRRVLHVGDMTGPGIGRVLLERAREHPGIRLIEHSMAVDLITARRRFKQREDRCLGAYLLDTGTNLIEPLLASVTILATGGSGKVYLYTSNPDVATGDGVAMAYRAGCSVVNMEFTQFHPTCLYHPEAKSFLISEAVRGEGGVLLGEDGRRFMEDVHEMAELAPRDIVARAIDAEIKRSGSDCVYLDISHKPRSIIRDRFPTLVDACARYGFDLVNEPVPVVPAAHYQCGGVWADENGRTDLPGLYAIGEVAFTGFHGANRMASNSLLECLAFGAFAADDVLAGELRVPAVPEDGRLDWEYGDAVPPDEQIIVAHNWDEVRRVMSNYVGIVRSDRRLERAERRIANLAQEVQEYYWGVIPNKDLLELRNLVQVAWLIVQSARRRKESRGLHYTIDHPETSPVAENTVVLPVAHYP